MPCLQMGGRNEKSKLGESLWKSTQDLGGERRKSMLKKYASLAWRKNRAFTVKLIFGDRKKKKDYR